MGVDREQEAVETDGGPDGGQSTKPYHASSLALKSAPEEALEAQ
ncbi:MAG: hypothetical protein RBU37_12040 [Myxococcota bacterium]|jgi:hypothetical protein|nr:hypothetical protein [Myxococcota bacterium]